MQTIVILDFGSQTTQLIARRVRELNVYCELLAYDAPRAEVERLPPSGMILSGGPASVYEAGAPQMPDYVFELGVPVLGICYGMMLLTRALGGVVSPTDKGEYGPATLTVREGNGLLKSLPSTLDAWMSHGDAVPQAPPGFAVLAQTATAPIAAMSDEVAISMACSFTPRSRTPSTAWTCFATSSLAHAAAARTGHPPISSRKGSHRCARR